jgi:hypothetical protein
MLSDTYAVSISKTRILKRFLDILREQLEQISSELTPYTYGKLNKDLELARAALNAASAHITDFVDDFYAEEPPDPDVIQDMLSLVMDKPPSVKKIKEWSAGDQAKAVRWAGAAHLKASDNKVRVPKRPDFL